MVEVVSILVILFLAGTLEVGVFSRLQILYGTADLVMVALIVWTLNSETRFTIVMEGAWSQTYRCLCL